MIKSESILSSTNLRLAKWSEIFVNWCSNHWQANEWIGNILQWRVIGQRRNRGNWTELILALTFVIAINHHHEHCFFSSTDLQLALDGFWSTFSSQCPLDLAGLHQRFFNIYKKIPWKNLVNAGIQTRGCLVRSANATFVLCSSL